MKLAVDAPINSLSFGNVSINLLREMYKKQMDIALFPVGEQADLEAFDRLDKDFVNWLFTATARLVTESPESFTGLVSGSLVRFPTQIYLLYIIFIL